MPARLRIVVAHPGRQHSHQTALALFEAGLLQAYWTGVPCLIEQQRFLPAWLKQIAARQSTINIPPQNVSWNPIAPVARRAGRMLLGQKLGAWAEYASYSVFDRWVARKLKEIQPDAVIAYENSALHTFRAASRRGVFKILDAASIHWITQDRVVNVSKTDRFHRRIAHRKDQEIALADHILTVSTLAKQTYVDAGVAPEKISVVPVGTDLNFFVPRQSIRNGGTAAFRFLFVGHISSGKGFDLLAQAFAGVRRGAAAVELIAAGSPGDAMHFLACPEHGITYLGRLTQQELKSAYADADCFVLPSRLDSYAMVVAEALACGVPVIVSDMVGAKDWVVAGENGWVVPFNDVHALQHRMAWCIENRDAVRAMRARARASALQMDWTAYREKLTATVKKLF